MTAQMPDRLIHHGRILDLCATPLEDCLRRRPKARRPKFLRLSTANWRGYVATWEILDQRLFLTGIEDGLVQTDGGPQEVTLKTLFPRGPFPKPATWVSGALRCPEGRLRNYVHAGFASQYERDRVFIVESGIVVEEWLVHNPPGPLHYLINPDGSQTYAEALTTRELAPEKDPFPGDGPVEPWRVWGDPDWDVWPDTDDSYVLGGYVSWR